MATLVQRVEFVIAHTQPSFSTLDISAIQRRARREPLMKAMTMFTNQRFKNLNIIARTVQDYRSGAISPQDAAKKLTLMIGITPLTLFAAEESVRQLVGTGADDAEEFRRRVNQSFISTNIGNIPIFSSFAQFMSDKMSSTYADSRFSRNPLEGFAEDTMTGFAKILNESSTDNLDGYKEILKNLTRAAGAPTKPFDLLSQLIENRF